MSPAGARADADAKRAKRASGGTRFLVTGATGFLGAFLLKSLLARGFRVTALARDGHGLPAAARVGRVLDWFGSDTDRRRLDVVAGDVAEPRCGLAEAEWEALAGRVDEVVHCAASTAFAERRRDELERVNVGGTGNLLALAAAGRASHVHLMSTAFAAGTGAGMIDGSRGEPAAFTNAYEETKHRAETVARAVAAGRGIALSVYRPGIVTGDSRTGRALRFNALYHPVKTVRLLSDLCLEDLRRGKPRAQDLGAAERPGGGLFLPLRVETDPASTLNLLPVDHLVRAFWAILEAHPEGGTFPIVTDEAIPVATVVGYIARLYRLDGLRAVRAQAFAATPRNALERLFGDYTRAYRPYMLERRVFGEGASRPALAAAGLRCPRFTYEAFAQLMRYAEEVDWGKRSGPGLAEQEGRSRMAT